MAVRTRDTDLKVITNVVEVRFDRGELFYDRRGELIAGAKREVPKLETKLVGTKIVTLHDLENNLVLNITPEKFDTTAILKEPTLAAASKVIQALARMSEAVYGPIASAVAAACTIRVGARFGLLAPADTLEESDRIINSAARSPFVDDLESTVGGKLVDSHLIFVTEDAESGRRCRVQLLSAITEPIPGGPAYTGLRGDAGSGGLLIDIDIFTRPDSGHFPKLEYFTNECFQKSTEMAKHLFARMIKPRKA